MSLNEWKLELCSFSSSNTATIPTCGLDHQHRKPPKSNISAQLRRLQDHDFPEDVHRLNDNVDVFERSAEVKGASVSSRTESEDGYVGENVASLGLASCLKTGAVHDFKRALPIEPLVLSDPGDPVVQV